MSMTEAQENQLANARAKAKQDKRIPMLINITDGRLLPNTPKLRVHASYRPYTGSLKASIDERMAYARSLTQGGGLRQVIDSGAQAEKPFDLAKASKEELIAFAAEEYQLVLDEKSKIADMRAEIQKAYSLRALGAPADDDMS